MAITSYGYDGTVSEVQWGALAASLGTDHGVEGEAFTATKLATLDRGVRLSTGTAYGWGVRDTSDTAEDVQSATVASGSRWDTIVLRRDWQPPGGTTSIVVVQGTASKAIASGLNNNPGVIADQPLWLVQVNAGDTLIGEMVDLRRRASKLLHVSDLLAVPNPPLGMTVRVGNTIYHRALSQAGTPEWDDGHSEGTLPLGTGWAARTSDETPRWHVSPSGWLSLSGAALRTSTATITPSGVQLTLQLPEDIRSPFRRLWKTFTASEGYGVVYNISAHRLEVRTHSVDSTVGTNFYVSFDGIGWQL